MNDSITEEIRSIRRQLAERDGNDVLRIFQRINDAQRTSGRQYVSFPPRKPVLVCVVERSSKDDLD